MQQFPDDFADMIDAFHAHGVEFLVVGAFAMARHGYVRATGDIDLLVHATPANSKRVLAALKDFGAPLFGIGDDYFASPGHILQIGQPPLRIDILTSIEGVDFPAAAARAEPQDFAGRSAPTLALEDLIRNKETNPRAKDAIDAAELRKLAARGPSK